MTHIFPNLDSSGIPNTYYYYEGYYYSFTGSGGYVGESGAPTLKYNINAIFEKFDMTDAVQVLFDVNTFNNKIGIVKDASKNVIDSSFNDFSGNFPNDSLTITAQEFVEGMNTRQIISLGRYSTLYRDFSNYIQQYFSRGAFVSFFDGASTYTINEGIFDPSAFIQMITGRQLQTDGTYVKDLSGSISIYNINNLLRTACVSDIFGNRDASSNPLITNGFLSGDLIFIPNGTELTLNVGIDTKAFLVQTQKGVSNVDVSNQDIEYVSPNQLFSIDNTATTNKISRTTTAPLLIRLANLPEEEITSYSVPITSNVQRGQYNWINRGHYYGNKQWTCVSVSHTGQNQLAGEYDGKLYNSDDYGITWNEISSIPNNNLWSSVAISYDGKYQVATGFNSYIYKSQDYGNTWIKSSNRNQWSNIAISHTGQHQTALIIDGYVQLSQDYGNTWVSTAMDHGKKDWKSVAISADGKFQAVVAYNDGIYESDNYGNTWTSVSGELFTTGKTWSSIAMSCEGQYQTVCVDNGDVYVSTDYGNSWNIKTDLGNKLWSNVAMSGTGQYQTALSRYDNIYMSNDYGNTWVLGTNDINYKPWSSVAISFSGNFQTTVVWNGSIYLSKLF